MKNKSKKHSDTAVRALEILKILTQGAYTKEEVIEKLVDADKLENEIRTDSLYKYGNTFKLFNLSPQKSGEKYTLNKIPFAKPFSEKEQKNITLLLQYSQNVLDKVKEILGIDVGQVTPDGKFSIEEVRCLGACGLAPVMTVNGEVYGHMDASKVKEILDQYN